MSSSAAEFNEIIRNPEKFHNKRVTFVAKVTGGAVERFYLYQPPEPKTSGADPRVIYGLISRESPLYERYDGKRVRVTGVIDTSYRGLAGENACSLLIERVRLAGKAKKPKRTCGGASCLELNFSQLLRNPKSYEHKCVCVTGFAHVRGDAFVIYESETAADGRAHPDWKKGIFVSQQPSDTTNYDGFNRRWIRIKGVVDMEQRGFADYPCGIIVEQVQAASLKKIAR